MKLANSSPNHTSNRQEAKRLAKARLIRRQTKALYGRRMQFKRALALVDPPRSNPSPQALYRLPNSPPFPSPSQPTRPPPSTLPESDKPSQSTPARFSIDTHCRTNLHKKYAESLGQTSVPVAPATLSTEPSILSLQQHDRESTDHSENPLDTPTLESLSTKRRGVRFNKSHTICYDLTTSITQIVADNQIGVRIRLNSPGLEGVEIEVWSQANHIECHFYRCPYALQQKLRTHQHQLKSALSHHDLHLRAVKIFM